MEIFISPNPKKVKNYYTFEINAIGTMLNRARTDWSTDADVGARRCSISYEFSGSERRKTNPRTIATGLWKQQFH